MRRVVNTGTLAEITGRSLKGLFEYSKEKFILMKQNIKKIMRILLIFSKYVITEILVKFIFCYLIAVVGVVWALSMDGGAY